jgi:hypothetical protein
MNIKQAENHNHDWRLSGEIHRVFARPADKKVNTLSDQLPEGTLCDFGSYNEKQLIFGSPSGPALFLNMSRRLHLQAEQRLKERVAIETPVINGKHPLSESSVFDFIEDYTGSIIFAHTALEAFVNAELPLNFIYEVDHRNHTKRYSKPQI